MTAARVLRERERREAAERARLDGLSIEEKIATAKAAAANRAADLMPVHTLPGVGPEVDLVTMTTHELWDLVWNATSTSLHESLPHLPKYSRHTAADRIAHQAVLIARGQDYLHQGPDPRA